VPFKRRRRRVRRRRRIGRRSRKILDDKFSLLSTNHDHL
jgi:hypothetical protein